MKFAVVLVLFFSFLQAKAQYIFIKCDAPFSIENANKTQAFTNVWIKISAPETPVKIMLSGGEKISRSFTKIDRPFYVVENGRVRYRPNMLPVKADTVFLGAATSIQKPTPAPAIAPQAETEKSDFDVLKQNICALQYEWEKTELIKEMLADQLLTCPQIADLLRCLTYDASRVEIINKHVKDAACLPELSNLVAEPFKLMIINR